MGSFEGNLVSAEKALEPLLTWFEFCLQFSICPDFNNLSHRLKKNHLQSYKFVSAQRIYSQKCLKIIKMKTSSLEHTEYELNQAICFKLKFFEKQMGTFLKKKKSQQHSLICRIFDSFSPNMEVVPRVNKSGCFASSEMTSQMEWSQNI